MKYSGSAVVVPDERPRQQRPDRVATSVEVALLDVVVVDLAGEQLLDAGHVDGRVVGMRALLVRERKQLRLGVAQHRAERPIHLSPGAVEVDERHADRRSREGALKARLGVPQLALDAPSLRDVRLQRGPRL